MFSTHAGRQRTTEPAPDQQQLLTSNISPSQFPSLTRKLKGKWVLRSICGVNTTRVGIHGMKTKAAGLPCLMPAKNAQIHTGRCEKRSIVDVVYEVAAELVDLPPRYYSNFFRMHYVIVSTNGRPVMSLIVQELLHGPSCCLGVLP